MCQVSGVLWQHQEASWQGVPHVLVPGHVGEDAILNDLRREMKKRETRAMKRLLLFSNTLDFYFLFFLFLLNLRKRTVLQWLGALAVCAAGGGGNPQ